MFKGWLPQHHGQTKLQISSACRRYFEFTTSLCVYIYIFCCNILSHSWLKKNAVDYDNNNQKDNIANGSLGCGPSQITKTIMLFWEQLSFVLTYKFVKILLCFNCSHYIWNNSFSPFNMNKNSKGESLPQRLPQYINSSKKEKYITLDILSLFPITDGTCQPFSHT